MRFSGWAVFGIEKGSCGMTGWSEGTFIFGR